MDTNRLNELEKMVEEKRATLSNRKFESWTIFHPEYRELMTLRAQAQTIANREQAQAHKNDWMNETATEKQIAYLKSLQVNIDGKRITKSLASQLIDAVKSGEGVGYLGFEMTDGSN